MAPVKLTITLLVFLIFTTEIYSQDWPQYLGPSRNGISKQKNLLKSWPEEGPEILWTLDVGIGFGGPVVQDGKVYLLDRDDEVGDNLRCVNLADGKQLWNFEYNAPGSVMFPGSRSVPTIDGKFIYTVGPYGDLHCVNISSGKPVWSKNIWNEYGGDNVPTWAITQSPLIYKDLLIVASQAPEAGVLAYDKNTGDIRWKTPSLGNAGYVSPKRVELDGEDHIIMISASGRRGGAPGKVVGISAQTGDILWEYSGWQCVIPIPNVVDVGNNKMLITGGYEAGSAMIKVEKKEAGYTVVELFKTEDFGTHTKPPLMYKDHFYAQYSTNERRDGLVCMNMEGEILWKTGRSPAFVRGSMILADGLIMATDGEKKLYLIEPDHNQFKPIGVAEMFKESEGTSDPRFGTQNWAPIALADGRLLIRDQGKLLCVKVADF